MLGFCAPLPLVSGFGRTVNTLFSRQFFFCVGVNIALLPRRLLGARLSSTFLSAPRSM